jgi:hypothetical protein
VVNDSLETDILVVRLEATKQVVDAASPITNSTRSAQRRKHNSQNGSRMKSSLRTRKKCSHSRLSELAHRHERSMGFSWNHYLYSGIYRIYQASSFIISAYLSSSDRLIKSLDIIHDVDILSSSNSERIQQLHSHRLQLQSQSQQV